MKIYTKTGDAGQTGVFGGPRVDKDDPRIEAYGAVDELNCVLGLARTAALPADIEVVVERLQHDLFSLGAELATPDPAAHGTAWAGPQQVGELEAHIDRFEAGLPVLKEFILPGGSPGAAWLHLARTVCRRAERCVVRLGKEVDPPPAPHVVAYLNRLGDLLFVLARAANQAAGQEDTVWQARSAQRGARSDNSPE